MEIIPIFLIALFGISSVTIPCMAYFNYIKAIKESEQQLEDIERSIDPDFEENRKMWNVFNDNYSIFITQKEV